MPKQHESDSMDAMRIDKWLWAARFFKTRSIAKAAIEGGKVDQAIQRFEDSLSVRPDHAAVMLNYADALIKKGEKEKAKAVLDTILTLPNSNKNDVENMYKKIQ